MRLMHTRLTLLGLATLLAGFAVPQLVRADWPMPGHDPQRTSYSPQAIPLATRALWHVKIDALIPSRSHIITVGGGFGTPSSIFVTAADGIHALDPDNGSERWLYRMEMPPGDAPAVVGDTLFVTGTDRSLHAVRASTGEPIWQTDRAGAPYYVSPLIVAGWVFVGNRDGRFYCFSRTDGSLLWSFDAGAPISISAAYQVYADEPKGVVYFAADNRCAFALRAADGEQVWAACDLPVGGFQTYWPVIVDDYVLLAGSTIYPTSDESDLSAHARDEILLEEIPLRQRVDARGMLDVQHHIDYLTDYPDRRSVLVLDRRTGEEAVVAPILWWGNPGGQRYPPAVGPDGVIWTMTSWLKTHFGSGRYAGWRIGSSKILTVPELINGLESADEPEAYSLIGSHIYHNDGGDGADKGGVESMSGGNLSFWALNTFYAAFGEYWGAWADRKYGNNLSIRNPNSAWDSSIGWHGRQTPPAPLNGKVYFHRSNAVICMGP